MRLRLQGPGRFCPFCLRVHCCNGTRSCSESPSINSAFAGSLSLVNSQACFFNPGLSCS